jgi:hypothetical protein
MSEGDIEDLVYLDRSRFDEREHLALSWVRAAVTSRDGAPAELDAGFSDEFDTRERRCIAATMQGMFISNLTTNTLLTWMQRLQGKRKEQPASCSII